MWFDPRIVAQRWVHRSPSFWLLLGSRILPREKRISIGQTALFFQASLCVRVLGKTSISDCRHHSEVTSYSSGFKVAVNNPLYIKYCLCWKDFHKTFQYIHRRPEHYSYISTKFGMCTASFSVRRVVHKAPRPLSCWRHIMSILWHVMKSLPQYHGHKWRQS
jgi:hypothetical protein